MNQALKYPPVDAEPACLSDFQTHIWCSNEHTCWWSNLFQTYYLSFASLQMLCGASEYGSDMFLPKPVYTVNKTVFKSW